MSVVKKIEEFAEYAIKELSIQFFDPDTKEIVLSERFGCTGKLTVETEMKNISRKCEGVVVEEITKPINQKLTGSGFITRMVRDQLEGLKNDNLKDGVYAYTENSSSLPFILTGAVEDMYGKRLLVAWQNVSNIGGLKLNLENGAEEVSELEFEFNAKKDDQGTFMYKAFEEELEDTTVKEKWLSEFNYELVKKIAV